MNNKEIILYTVVPKLPERLKPLIEISKNLWFSWNIESIELFRSIDPVLWEESGHNPLGMISRLNIKRISELMEDDGFLLEMDRIYEKFKRYMEDGRTYDFGLEAPIDFTTAYFSAEYGLTDCLPIYSGGLGVLAGDHLKSASDLRIPIVGVGLLYQKGYFRQYLNADGWQHETYPDNDFHTLPITLERDKEGNPLAIDVPIKNRNIKVRIWRIQVGRVPLIMLDTNTVLNSDEDRDITSYLYGGDREMRLKQEIVLGIGGVRALTRLKIRPAIFHMNEGHSAFAMLERIRMLMEEHLLSFEEARESVYCSSVFTTHTPVEAGIDTFDRSLISSFLGDYINFLGISMETFLSMGRQSIHDPSGPFNMAVMAIRNSARINGVSNLHKHVSRRMWRNIWAELPEVDLPIEHITNGVHIPSWISKDMAILLDRYLGKQWSEDPDNVKVWERVSRIPDLELWRTHERRRERLVAFARRKLQEQLIRWGATKREIREAGEVLNPQALTIGFARRFATYKRGNLILKDPSRLAKILNNQERPVQIIFAGKAHPQDQNGKEVIRHIIQFARKPEFFRRIVFIEDYDMIVARYLVQGSDVWLNTPKRPLEACGTSGMKAAANGVLNMSVLDGWWAEGYQSGLGWAIGDGEEYENQDYQDYVESQAIYNLLEKAVVTLFYERGKDNLPAEWVSMMKKSIQNIASYFNSHRMLEEYVHRFYLPSAIDWSQIQTDNFKKGHELTEWIKHMRATWQQIKIIDKRVDVRHSIEIGNSIKVEVILSLGQISPEDISVDIYYGRVDSKAEFLDRSTKPLRQFVREDSRTIFYGELPCEEVGRFGFLIRVMPRHPLLSKPHSLGLILWG
ncbi:MAG: alpha-glucan family phosphorylase [Thermodesulfovibrionales bacterium]